MLGPKYLCITYFFYFKQTSLYFIIYIILLYYIQNICILYIYMHPTQHGLLKSISAHGRGVAAR